MLDVHPPHQTPHSWRDFFVHIATIVFGLLIAIGLEQTVEAIHHHYQRRELRAGFLTDARLMQRDAAANRSATVQHMEDLTARIDQVRSAITSHSKLAPAAYRPQAPAETFVLGNMEAASSSGLITLLSPDELSVLAEPQAAAVRANFFRDRTLEAQRRRVAFERRFQSSYPAGPLDFSPATVPQMDVYIQLLEEEREAFAEYADYLGLMHRGATLFLQNQRDMDELRHAERDVKE